MTRTVLRPRRALVAPCFAFSVALSCALAAYSPAAASVARADAVRVIDEDEIEDDVAALAAPHMEGRDAPSEGFRRAGRMLATRLAEYGFQPAPDAEEHLRRHGGGAGPSGHGEDAGGAPVTPGGGGGDDAASEDAGDPTRLYHRPYARNLWAPVPAECSLILEVPGEEPRAFTYGADFVPLLDCDGGAEGELSFAGFGIKDGAARYDDFRGVEVEDRVVVLLEGEPRHKRKFGGLEDFVPESNVWAKLGELANFGDGPSGVLVVRRRPHGADEDVVDALDFRHTHASFVGRTEPVQTDERRAPVARRRPPVLEITTDVATELFGVDVEKLAARVDQSGKPARLKPSDAREGARVRLRSKSRMDTVRCDNIVGVLPGSDPALAGEYVLLGAHYDHIGVNPGGVVGAGADDNASGCAALLQVAKALAQDPPRRGVIVCFFGSEEDGLHGSKAIADDPPVPRESIVAMVNLDMVGRGDAKEVAVLGIKQNPALEDVLERARRASKTGIKSLVLRKGEELFARSDQYNFHQVGIPVLFFFEGLPISRNEDYHTWRDVPELVDPVKVRNTARLAFETTWILASDDERPPAPRR